MKKSNLTLFLLLIILILFISFGCTQAKCGDSKCEKEEQQTCSADCVILDKNQSLGDKNSIYSIYPVASHKNGRFGIVGYFPKLSEIPFFAINQQSVIWGNIEPNPPISGKHTYVEPKLAEFYKTLTANDPELFVVVRHENDWAMERDSNYIVQDPADGHKDGALMKIKSQHLEDWKSYITHVVTKYPVSYLEVSSEAENVWGDANGYIESLCAAYGAAKKANPNIKVVAAGFNLGGLILIDDANISQYLLLTKEETDVLPTPIKYYTYKMKIALGTLDNGGNCFDILSIHHDHGKTYEELPLVVEEYNKRMQSAGYTKPIWLDNMHSGYYPKCSGKTCSPEDTALINELDQKNQDTINEYAISQSSWVVKKAVGAFGAGIEKVFVDSPSDWVTYFMPEWRYVGLLQADGKTPKQAFYTTKIMVDKLDYFTSVEKLTNFDENVYAYRFSFNDKKPVVVAWTEGESEVIDLSSNFNENVNLTFVVTKLDSENKPIYLTAENRNPKSIKISQIPTFIE